MCAWQLHSSYKQASKCAVMNTIEAGRFLSDLCHLGANACAGVEGLVALSNTELYSTVPGITCHAGLWAPRVHLMLRGS
jgi:hypothetical protein